VFDPSEVNPALRGYYGRKGDHVIKLAMICSASLNNSMQITDTDVSFAIELLGENERYLNNMIQAITETEVGKKITKVKQYLHKHARIDPVPHSQVMRAFSYSMDKDELYVILCTLEQAGLVQIQINLSGKGRNYKYIGAT
jgi:mevalonate pyrophosphate decarboxylase